MRKNNDFMEEYPPMIVRPYNTNKFQDRRWAGVSPPFSKDKLTTYKYVDIIWFLHKCTWHTSPPPIISKDSVFLVTLPNFWVFGSKSIFTSLKNKMHIWWLNAIYLICETLSINAQSIKQIALKYVLVCKTIREAFIKKNHFLIDIRQQGFYPPP